MNNKTTGSKIIIAILTLCIFIGCNLGVQMTQEDAVKIAVRSLQERNSWPYYLKMMESRKDMVGVGWYIESGWKRMVT